MSLRKKANDKHNETFYDILENYVEDLRLPDKDVIDYLKEIYDSTYKSEIDPDAELNIIIDKNQRKVIIEVKLEVVEDDFPGWDELTHVFTHIKLSEAKKINKKIEVGQSGFFPVPNGLVTNQFTKSIIGKLRSFKDKIKSDRLLEKYQSKVGTIIKGQVTTFIRGSNSHHVDVGDCIASLPSTETIPGERIGGGVSILCALKEIDIEGSQFKMILSRRNEDFVKGIFREEIEEIKNEEVEIKRVVRYPGTLSVVLVHTEEPDIKPELACIGRAGSRIKSIREWMNNEQVIVSRYNPNVELQFLSLFSPDVIEHVSYNGHERVMNVWVRNYEDNIGSLFGTRKGTIRAAQEICNLFDIRIFDSENKETSVDKIVGEVHEIAKPEERKVSRTKKATKAIDDVENVDEQTKVEEVSREIPEEKLEEIHEKREEKKAAAPEKIGDEVEIVTIKTKKEEKKPEDDFLAKVLEKQKQNAQAYMEDDDEDFDEDFDDDESYDYDDEGYEEE